MLSANGRFVFASSGVERKSLSVWIKFPAVEDNSFLVSIQLQKKDETVGYGSFAN